MTRITSLHRQRRLNANFPPAAATLCAVGFLLVVVVPRTSAALTLEQCISDDGHVYVIVTTASTGIGTQVTSVAMAQGSSRACAEQGLPAGGVVSAYAGCSGSPLDERMRTSVLTGFATNAVSCETNFDPHAANGKGVLYLPGPAARAVSADPGFSGETLIPIAAEDETMPGALELQGLNRRTGGRCGGDSIVFPAGGDGSTPSDGRIGEVANQAVTFEDTLGTRVGNAASQSDPDGFLLKGDCSAPSTCQMVVFVGTLGADGCSIGSSSAAAGFTVDSNMNTRAAEAALRTVSGNGCPVGAQLNAGYGDVTRTTTATRLRPRFRRAYPTSRMPR